MELTISRSSAELGARAAEHAAAVIRRVLEARPVARVVFSTGKSQLDTIDALVRQDVDWSRVEGFHLDEYVGLPDTHPASFRRYLSERLVSRVSFRRFHFVAPEGDPQRTIAELSHEVRSAPIDLGLIGIGENAHIAFNDPPADFTTDEAFIVVTLDDRCRQQQVGEGWFADISDVPSQAVTMTVRQIMRCTTVISSVPFAVKADAIRAVFGSDSTPMIPATILKQHPDFHLFLDERSAAQIGDRR